jgi:hypothetical protein
MCYNGYAASRECAMSGFWSLKLAVMRLKLVARGGTQYCKGQASPDFVEVGDVRHKCQ